MLVCLTLAACDDDVVGPGRQPAELAFVGQPSDAEAYTPITPAVVVELQDADGELVAATGAVTISIDENPGGGTLFGTTTVDAVDGIAEFADLSIDVSTSGYTLLARLDSLSATSEPFAVQPVSTAQLVFLIQPPTSHAKRQTIAPPVQLELRDRFGDRITTFADDVTIGLADNPGAMIFHASGTSDGDRVLEYVDPTTPEVLAPLPNSPSTAVLGMVFDPQDGDVVAISFGSRLSRINVVTGVEQFVGVIDVPDLKPLTFESGPAGRLLAAGTFGDELYELDATTATTSLLGRITIAGDSITGFNGLATDPSDGTIYAVVQLRDNADRRVRDLVTIDVGMLTATNIGTLSETGVAGIAFMPNGELIAVTGDGATNPEVLWGVDKASAALTVIVALGAGDEGEAIAAIPARLSGTVTVTAVAGLATFDDLVIDAPADGYTFVAAAAGLTVTSTPFDIAP